MSNELVTVRDKLAWASELAKSAMLPKHMQGNPANLLYACELAESLGMAPIVAITSVHVIEGKPSASAGLISALVRKAGHRLRVFGDDRSATAQIWRADDPEFCFEAVWTMERARNAGLTGKSVWKSYPAAMLQARAITEVARQACQDCLSGVQYTPEELSGDDPQPVQVSRGGQIAANIAASTAPRQLAQEPAAAAPTPPAQPAQEAAGWRDDKDRKWFMAQLGDMGLSYDDLCAWREGQGKPRPSGLTPTQRKMLLAALANPESKTAVELRAWFAARQPEAPPVDAVPDDDTPFFGEE